MKNNQDRINRRSFVKRTGAVTLGSVLGLGILPSINRRLHATDTSVNPITVTGVQYSIPATKDYVTGTSIAFSIANAKEIQDYQSTNISDADNPHATQEEWVHIGLSNAPGVCGLSLTEIVTRQVTVTIKLFNAVPFTRTIRIVQPRTLTCQDNQIVTTVGQETYFVDGVQVTALAAGYELLSASGDAYPGEFINPKFQMHVTLSDYTYQGGGYPQVKCSVSTGVAGKGLPAIATPSYGNICIVPVCCGIL